MTAPPAEWIPAPQPEAAPEAAAALAARGLPPHLAALLARRGIGDPAEAERFLDPSPDQLHDPFLLAGMEEAVERLLDARRRGERVAVVGDYDVDGVTSTALLSAVLGACGIETETILPHRMRDGYGFQPTHVERAHRAGCSLIVTVDCGTTSDQAISAARDAGIDVLVTDHHLPGDGLPAGTLEINPRRVECSYPFGELAAVGLTLKLCLALAGRCDRRLPLAPLLRIACLGTIADLVPLVGENRVIAALGLAALAETPSAGLRALFQSARVRPPFTASDVGFRIGPRLNAAGRLAEADIALELLLCRDPKRGGHLAAQLERLNRERQSTEQRVVEEAREALIGRSPMPRVAVAWSEGWHRGVVGIAAGRLARELHRPTLLLAVEGETATGSGRSIRGVELHAFLKPWSRRLTRFGGHAQAVGLAVGRGDLETLRGEWEEAAAGWPEELLTRRHEYELELAPGEIGAELLAELGRLEPHGQGNPRPLARIGPLSLAGEPRSFGRGHLSGRARGEGGAEVDIVGWGWQERAHLLQGRIEVLAYVEHDSYRGGPVLRLVDARPA